MKFRKLKLFILEQQLNEIQHLNGLIFSFSSIRNTFFADLTPMFYIISNCLRIIGISFRTLFFPRQKVYANEKEFFFVRYSKCHFVSKRNVSWEKYSYGCKCIQSYSKKIAWSCHVRSCSVSLKIYFLDDRTYPNSTALVRICSVGRH